MNKYKFAKISLVASLGFLLATPVFASSPAEAPTCHIEGTVQAVEYEEAQDSLCAKSESGCPSDFPSHIPERYHLNVHIDSVSYISGITRWSTCEESFPVDSEQSILILKANVNPGDTIAANQKIEGSVNGSKFVSYTLDTSKDEPLIQSPLIIILISTFIVTILVGGVIYKIISSRKKLA